MAPGQTLELADALANLWSLAGQTGAVTVSFDQAVEITAYKYADTPSRGRIGTPLPVIAESDLLESGAVADLVWISQSADPASGSSATLGFYLSVPGSSATVSLYDQSGKQVGQTSVSGGPQYSNIAVGSLIQTNLPIARAQIQVGSGRVTAYSEIIDNVTGEPMATRIATANDEDTILTLNGVMRQTGSDGVLLATDMRILNLGAAPAQVNIFLGAANFSTMVPARGAVELPDVLGGSLNLTGAVGGTVVVTANHAVAAAGRLVRRDASGGALGAIEVGSMQPGGVSTSQVAVVGGLRSSQNTSAFLVSSAAADSAGGADLSLQDGSGRVVASIPGAIQLAAAASRVDSLATLLGAAVPDIALLQLTGSAGGLSLDAVSIDQTGGAPSYLRVDPVVPYFCAPPSFTSISVSPPTLAQPGNVTVGWTTQTADSVTVPSISTPVGTNDSVTIGVTGPTTVSLIATNSCGSVTAVIPIYVGTPQATSVSNISNIAAPSPASGSPGDAIGVNVTNLADLTTVTSVNFRGADGQTLSVPVIDATVDGNVLVRVPMWPTATAPGYRTGSFQLSVTVGSAAIGAIPFTINSLSYTGDPVAGFGKLLDQIAAEGNATIAALKANGYSATANMQQQAAAGVEQTLRKMVSDISSAGVATVPADFNPQGTTVQVSRNDLAFLLAYYGNAVPLTPNNAASPSVGVSSRKEGAGAPKFANPANCLGVQRPLVPICKPLEAEARLENLASQYLGIFNPGDLQNLPGAGQIASYLKSKFTQSAIGALTKRLNVWLGYYDYVCLLAPIRLQNFSVYPKAIIQRPDRRASEVDLKANLTAFTTSDQLADQLENQEIKLFLNQYCSKCSSSDQQAITNALKPILQQENNAFDQTLANIARTVAGLGKNDSVQVGICDIQNFYPLHNGWQNDPSYADRNPSSLLVPDFSVANYGDLPYWYFARRRGPETFCVDPYLANFVLPLQLERAIGSAYKECRPEFRVNGVGVKTSARSAAVGVNISPPAMPPDPSPVTYSDDVAVGDGVPQVVINQNDLNAYTSGSPTDNPNSSSHSVTDSKPFSISAADGYATSTLTATQVSATRWTVQISADSVPVPITDQFGNPAMQYHVSDSFVMLDFTNPPVRDDTQHMHLSIKSSDTSCPIYQWRVSWADDAGNPSGQSQQNQPLDLEMPGGVVGHLSMTVTPHGGNSAACVLTATIDMLPQ